MNNILSKIQTIGIVPVIVIDDEKDAVPLAKALCRGGLPVAEVTFRTKAAKSAIQKMTEECKEMLVGAGTILTKEQADQAIEAGAKFIVSPGLNPEVVKHCLEKQVTVIP
ncbi:MAG: keto-hydroxyglutarate-aldolase/keto-deoxy-phosphogluconate aldolase, partial [Clostridia bacterium]|nr:keto-hydroxyglutarate-aldolase/keto-deoxy-phosphogluconate aldolase [Clostridia bacterium]